MPRALSHLLALQCEACSALAFGECQPPMAGLVPEYPNFVPLHKPYKHLIICIALKGHPSVANANGQN